MLAICLFDPLALFPRDVERPAAQLPNGANRNHLTAMQL